MGALRRGCAQARTGRGACKSAGGLRSLKRAQRGAMLVRGLLMACTSSDKLPGSVAHAAPMKVRLVAEGLVFMDECTF